MADQPEDLNRCHCVLYALGALGCLAVVTWLLSGCTPNGYHSVCDQWDVIYNVYYFDGKTPSIIPTNYCSRSHLEKDRVR